MKIKLSWFIVGVCSLSIASASSENVSSESAGAAEKAASVAPESKSPATVAPPSPGKSSESQPDNAAVEAAKRAHIRPGLMPIAMDTPPPPSRAEKKTPLPISGLVWVPGHWTPVNGKWQWTPGEWDVPATPVSVWIEAHYDAKTKQWTAGYWQPDREAPYEPETPRGDAQPATVKF